MQNKAFVRTTLFIAISGTAGFFAGRHSLPLPSSAFQNGPAPARVVSAGLVSPVTLPGNSKNSGTTSKADSPPPQPSLADDGEESLALLLSRIGGTRDYQKIGSELADWLASNPDEVVAYLAKGSNQNALADLFAIWAKKDPHAASLWLSGHPDAPGRDNMAAGLAAGVALEDRAAAMQWVAAIKDPVIKVNAGREAGWVTYRSNEAEAEAGLRDAGIPESAIPSIKEGWQKQFSTAVTHITQGLISTANAARAAGATFKATNPDDIVSNMSTGVKGGGQFSKTIFMVENSDWTSRELEAVKQKFTVTDGLSCIQP